MRPGPLPSAPSGLTIRLLAVHLSINAVRETLQDLPAPAALRYETDPETLTPPVTRQQPSRRVVRAVVLLAALTSLAGSAAPAHAAGSCGKQVINDWYDGRIDGTYDLHCYDDAIEQLPRDLRDYSSAPDDIQRALTSRMRGEKAPPNRDPVPTDTGPGEPAPTPPPGEPPVPDPQPGEKPAGPDDPVALPPPGESASSVPVPLLILAGLALLLVAGGSAGYVIRRFQSRRIPPPAL